MSPPTPPFPSPRQSAPTFFHLWGLFPIGGLRWTVAALHYVISLSPRPASSCSPPVAHVRPSPPRRADRLRTAPFANSPAESIRSVRGGSLRTNELVPGEWVRSGGRSPDGGGAGLEGSMMQKLNHTRQLFYILLNAELFLRSMPPSMAPNGPIRCVAGRIRS